MKRIVIAGVILLMAVSVHAQTAPPFRKEIDAFKRQDSLSMPPKGMILFVGSSSFTKWTDVQSYFPGYPILNRGFGGSSLPDVIRYADEVIFPYQPKQVVIYCGENDIAASDTVTAHMVFNRFVTLYGMIRSHLGSVPVAFISIKPSPSRRKFRPVVIEANRLIEQYIKSQRNAAFINVYDAMLGPDGREKAEIFVQDSLHMNAKGYAIWQPVIQKALKK